MGVQEREWLCASASLPFPPLPSDMTPPPSPPLLCQTVLGTWEPCSPLIITTFYPVSSPAPPPPASAEAPPASTLPSTAPAPGSAPAPAPEDKTSAPSASASEGSGTGPAKSVDMPASREEPQKNTTGVNMVGEALGAPPRKPYLLGLSADLSLSSPLPPLTLPPP